MKIQSESKYMWITVLIVALGTFMASLDSSIVNIAIPKMMSVFSVSMENVQWVVTGYLLTLGIVIPLSGYLSDRFGTKTVFMSALLVFAVGSALCALAWNIDALIGARVLQAIGGGMIMPVGMTILFKTVPLEKRGMALGVWGISMFAAPTAGPVISGYLIQYSDWRMIFTLNIPIGILAVILGIVILKETPLIKGGRLDIPGAATSAAGLFTLLLALSKSSSKGWDSMYVMVLLFISVIMLTAFVLIELKSKNPLIDLRVLRALSYSAGLAASSISMIAMFGIIFFTPIYFQNIKGYTSIHAGLILMVSGLVMAPVTVLGGKLFDRFGARWIAGIGLLIAALMMGVLSRTMTLETDDLTLIVIFSICSVGMGLAMMPMQTASMNAVSKELVSRASALFRTMLQISGSLGIALLTTLLQDREPIRIVKSLQAININIGDMPVIQLTQDKLASLASKSGASILQVDKAVKEAFVYAMDDTFFILAFVMIAGMLLALLLPGRNKRHHRSGDASGTINSESTDN